MMINILDPNCRPELEDLQDYVNNPVFGQFCSAMKTRYQANEKMEFSACSWEHGWNVKFKKAGRNLCTIYPREGFFTVLVVIGQKEKEAADLLIQECTPTMREIYEQTKIGNGQKWLMIDLEDDGKLLTDVFRFLDLRRGSTAKKGSKI